MATRPLTKQHRTVLTAEVARLREEYDSLGVYPPRQLARRRAIELRLKRIESIFSAEERRTGYR